MHCLVLFWTNSSLTRRSKHQNSYHKEISFVHRIYLISLGKLKTGFCSKLQGIVCPLLSQLTLDHGEQGGVHEAAVEALVEGLQRQSQEQRLLL